MMAAMLHRLSFMIILAVTWPVRWLPYSAIHRLGRLLGTIAYFSIPKFRKRALSNLALATSLQLSEKQIRRHARESLQNLMITCLEYAKFSGEKNIHRVATCANPETADALMKENKPVIFFCGHQSNWEVLFLEGTTRMPGVAIGRPIDNAILYRWVLAIRQKFGGKMVERNNAVREGLRGLKRGSFLGIVGDQGMPDSGYSCPFFGRTAWSSPMPAILSYRTGSPIMVATTNRKDGRYHIHYSDPIWPNSEAPMDQEVDRLMRASLAELEKSIKNEPGQWLWSHNRWKQQTRGKLRTKFRHESILIILSKEEDLSPFREIYPNEFITVYAPRGVPVQLEGAEIVHYSSEDDLLKRDYRFKLVFNFTSFAKVKPHFLRLAAFTVVSQDEIPGPHALKKAALHAP